MKTVLILEDNPQTLKTLAAAVSEVRPDLKICQTRSAAEAFAAAFSHTIDIFLLDIILTSKHPGDISGFLFAKKIREHERYRFTPVIFLTALEDQRCYAYSEIHSYSYLEKPYSMQKVKELVADTLEFPGTKEEPEEIYLRKDGILYQIRPGEVEYVECQNHKLQIHSANNCLEVPYYTLKWFMKAVPDRSFLQCSRSAAVNRRCIEYIDVVNGYIQLRGRKEMIDIGSRYRKSFLKELENG